MMRIWMILGLCLTLAGCGNDPSRSILSSTILQGLRPILQGNAEQAPAQAPEITRAAFAGFSDPVILASVPKFNVRASLGQVARNGDLQTYLAADGISLMIRNGMLVGTRGFGDDLMSAEVDIVRSVIQSGGGNAQYRLWHLDDMDQDRETNLICRVRAAGAESVTILGLQTSARLFVQTCPGWPLQIENKFWVSNGTIIKSLQYVSPTVGMIQLEQIK